MPALPSLPLLLLLLLLLLFLQQGPPQERKIKA